MTASESLIHLTIRIVCDTPHGQSCGTGFFFQHSTSKEGVTIPVIVTNKHVVRGATTGYLVFSLCDDSHNYIPGKNHTYQISNFEKAWIFHPDNNVDLCVLPIHQFYKKYKPDEYNLYMVLRLKKTSLPRRRRMSFHILKMLRLLVIQMDFGMRLIIFR